MKKQNDSLKNQTEAGPRYLLNFETSKLPAQETDFLIVGSGIAGLVASLKLVPFGKVTLVTKEKLEACSTEQAQGGIAAALAPSDSPALHEEDTLRAGAGLCNSEAVKILVTEGRERVRELLAWGVPFDREKESFAFTREGAHREKRVLHVGGDATGEGIWRTLIGRVQEKEGLALFENLMLVDLLVSGDTCKGGLFLDEENKLRVIWSPVTILATGGAGQLYPVTTNPEVATGDGVALAYRAGAQVMDLEFVQFHPTVLYASPHPPFLISEAVRGEGAVLRNQKGKRFLPSYHPEAELASRDEVSRAIIREMEKEGVSYVYLDATSLGEEYLRRRFPHVYQTCLAYGFDLAREWVPVAPAAHYFMGGVKTNLWGETKIRGLYAAGEVACNGVHGANRLASNSLLEGLVFGVRAAERAHAYFQQGRKSQGQNFVYFQQKEAPSPVDWQEVEKRLQKTMQAYGGVTREGAGLEQALKEIASLWPLLTFHAPQHKALEVQNRIILAWLVITAALAREESRGAHYRLDFPRREAAWEKHLVFSREACLH